MQHHAGQRPARALAPVGAAPLGPLHLAGRLQRVLGPAVAPREAMLGRQLLVEVLDREVEVAAFEQLQHRRHLIDRRAPRRHPAQPPVVQPVGPVGLPAAPTAPERADRQAEQIRRLLATQPTPIEPSIDLLEPHDPYFLQHP
jgi:hypothetical protein